MHVELDRTRPQIKNHPHPSNSIGIKKTRRTCVQRVNPVPFTFPIYQMSFEQTPDLFHRTYPTSDSRRLPLFGSSD